MSFNLISFAQTKFSRCKIEEMKKLLQYLQKQFSTDENWWYREKKNKRKLDSSKIYFS